ncbi:MAG: hypothetical protein RIC55_13830 [Pirellulaceae bacterium]
MAWKLALLGASHDALEIARAVKSDPRFSVACWLVDDRDDADLLRLAPAGLRVDEWQAMLSGHLADAVVVSPMEAGDEASRQEQLRRIAQNETPLLLIQPACEAILAFELDMIRDDTGAPLVAYTPGMGHPALAEMSRMIQAGEASAMGATEQLLLERRLRDRRRESVVRSLVRDIGLLRETAGSVASVNATAAGQDGWASLNVTLTTNAGVLVRWAVSPAAGDEGGRLSAVGSRGKAVLEMPDSAEAWRLEIVGDAPSTRTIDHDSPRAALDLLDDALSSKSLSSKSAKSAGRASSQVGVSNWPEACRDLEVAGVVEESLRRGRTVPIHGAIASEEKTFKGMMAVGGCAVILLLLAGVLVWAVVEGIRLAQHQPDAVSADGGGGKPARSTNSMHVLLRLWPVYPLAAFLLLQLLLLVLLDRPKRATPSTEQGKPPPVESEPPK